VTAGIERRVVVIGGGITGAFAAYFLARDGVRVTLLERDGVAAHASGANPGGLNPLHGPGIPGPLQELALASFRLNLEHWEEIGRRSGIDFAGRLVARIHVALDDEEAGALAALGELHNATAGCSAQLLSGAELREREPRISADAVAGLLVTGNGCVDPGAYTRAVAAASGARVAAAEATGLRTKSERVTGVLAGAEAIDCDGVVVACGPWTDGPADWLGVELPVEPVKGELLLVAPESGQPLASDVSRREAGAYTTAGEGIWLGGIEERAGFDETPTAEGRESILGKIEALLPGLGPVRVLDHVAALRPATPDGMPIVEASPLLENACVATGGGRKGMLLGAALGKAAAEALAA
jgi:glycine oxidase